jgi:hypothetical protein
VRGMLLAEQESGAADRHRVCVEIRKSACETLALLTLAYGEYPMRKSSVCERHRRFQDGREDVQDDPRSGQSKAQSTEANVRRVRAWGAQIEDQL